MLVVTVDGYAHDFRETYSGCCKAILWLRAEHHELQIRHDDKHGEPSPAIASSIELLTKLLTEVSSYA